MLNFEINQIVSQFLTVLFRLGSKKYQSLPLIQEYLCNMQMMNDEPKK